jgi:hypothetical protein
MAQYISIEVAEMMGYEGASYIKNELESGFRFIGSNLGYLMDWTPSYQPTDEMYKLYVSSYYVIRRLGEFYGQLEFYNSFFKMLDGARIANNDVLAHYLSLAAGNSIIGRLNDLGFNLVDLNTYSTLIAVAEITIGEVHPFFQPYKLIAEQFYRTALESDGASRKYQFLISSILIAELSSLLTVITYSTITLVVLLYILKRKNVFFSKSDSIFLSE